MAESERRQPWGEVRASRVRLLLAAALEMAKKGETPRAVRVLWHATQFMPSGGDGGFDETVGGNWDWGVQEGAGP